MPRRDTKITPPLEIKTKHDPNIITEIRKYKVITPLYGGGVEPENADPITVVRASEIRGHLRFWWRATRGGACDGDLKKMKAAEDAIWGAEGGKDKPGPSKVSVVIQGPIIRGKTISKAPTKKGLVDYGDVKSPYGYVAFPLRKTADKNAGSVREGVAFTLEIRYPNKYAKDVQAALWAWETFGGIGARTRRGFGALQHVNAPAPPSAQLEQEIRKMLNLNDVVSKGHWPPGVPHLSAISRLSLTDKKSSSEIAWQTLFNALKEFRQTGARYDRKTGKRSPYGLSSWPEANAIRQFFKLPGRFRLNSPKKVVSKFPRSVLGLPINFEMHHDGDRKVELQGADHERLASPLILRPIACSDGAVGLALVLEWELVDSDEPYTPPGGLRLKDAPGNPAVKSQLTTSEAQQIPVLNGKTDVLQAFLDYVKGK